MGDKNPNLIIYENDNITNNNNLDNNNLLLDGCSSTVIQINDNDCAFTYRTDSPKSVYANILYQKDGILHSDRTNFFFPCNHK